MKKDTNSTEFIKTVYIGKAISIFTNIEQETGLLGEGCILSYEDDIEEDLSFVRKEMPSSKQEVWAPRLCRIQLTSVTTLGKNMSWIPGATVVRKIAVPYRLGIASSNFNIFRSLREDNLIDNFEIIPGWGQCF